MNKRIKKKKFKYQITHCTKGDILVYQYDENTCLDELNQIMEYITSMIPDGDIIAIPKRNSLRYFSMDILKQYQNLINELLCKKVICILGRSASGKTSIAKEVCKKLNLQMVKSYTTRKPRKSELENSDHIFITPEQVTQYNPIAYTKIGETEYFVTEKEISQGDVYVIDPNGLEYLEDHLPPNYSLEVVYIASDRDTGAKRALERGDDPDEWAKRYDAENEQFESFERAIECGERQCHVVNNDSSLEVAVNQVIEVIRCED